MGVIVESERLLVRRWTPDDAEAAFDVYGDPEVTRYLGGTGEPDADVEQTRASLERAIGRYDESPGFGFWAVVERASGRVVGGALLAPLEGGPEIEVGYHFGRDAWGKGYATEVTKALVRYGFEELGLERVVGVVFPDNRASRQVLEKAGLTYEGRGRYFGHDLDRFAVHAREDRVAARPAPTSGTELPRPPGSG